MSVEHMALGRLEMRLDCVKQGDWGRLCQQLSNPSMGSQVTTPPSPSGGLWGLWAGEPQAQKWVQSPHGSHGEACSPAHITGGSFSGGTDPPLHPLPQQDL